MNIGLRIKELRKSKKLTIKSISNDLGIDSSQFSKIEREEINPTITQLTEISSFFNVSIDYLVRGEHTFKNSDVNTIEETSLEYHLRKNKLDLDNWFSNATSSFVYYGDSMQEYTNGCILILKQILNIENIIWGKNYVIQTDEFTITKKVAELNNEYILGYSTNEEKYNNGLLKYQPIKIKKSAITKVALVLGYITKNETESIS